MKSVQRRTNSKKEEVDKMRAIALGRGQSTAEYAILFAIVIGAAIAMQQYVSARLRGAVRGYANQYTEAAGTGEAIDGLTDPDVSPFGGDPSRQTTSTSAADTVMTTATQGTVLSRSGSRTVAEFTGGTGTPGAGTPGAGTPGAGTPGF